jgi:uncharacterized protein with FMN-binding domain
MLKARRVMIYLSCAAASFFIFACKNLEKIDRLTIEDITVSAVKDGDYQGSQNYFPVTAKVVVSVKDGRITNIKLLAHQHGKGYGADAIVERVLTKQSLMVDAVSGASYSSKVVLKAIESALKKGM